MSRPKSLYLVAEIGVTLAILIALWFYTEANANYLIPRMSAVFWKFQEHFLFSGLVTDVWPSLRRLVAGYGVAAVAGIVAGVAIGMYPALRMLADPVLALLRALPPVTLIPPAMLILGIDDGMKIFVIAFVCIWPILINASDGVREIDDTLLATARAYGLTWRERIFRVVLPSASPRIFVGLRTSLGFALLLLVASEFLAGTDGLGFYIAESQITYRIADMWSGILMLSIVGYCVNSVFTIVERRLIGWSRRGVAE
jgi:ABC-type nitrate/sulfonate/bicarbonate transport system permease component